MTNTTFGSNAELVCVSDKYVGNKNKHTIRPLSFTEGGHFYSPPVSLEILFNM